MTANWLSKQAIWQIYLPRPKQINFSHFDVTVPNEAHQANVLFLPHDSGYKYALTVIDIASQYKQEEPLRTKSATEVASAFERIYRKGPLRWPNLLQVDPGKEFQGFCCIFNETSSCHNTTRVYCVTSRSGNC